MNKFFARAAKAVTEGVYPPTPERKALCGKGFECLTNKKHGFTLAEILISLLILGVIASLTIPSLIQNTHKKEEQVKFKKVLSMVNQAISMDKALTGDDLSQYISGYRTLLNIEGMFRKRLSVTEPASGYFQTPDGSYFYFEDSAFDYNPANALSDSNCLFHVEVYLKTLSDKDIEDEIPYALHVTHSQEVYILNCGYDRCVPNDQAAAFMNAKDPSKLKFVSGQWVEQ